MNRPSSTTRARATVRLQHGTAAFSLEVALHNRLPTAKAMQRRAQATGLETAFLAPSTAASDEVPSGPSASFRARWFSPHGEMHLCGAGALVAALFLYDGHIAPAHAIIFDTAAGRLRARYDGLGRVAVQLPRYTLSPYTPTDALLTSLGLAASPPAFASAAAQTVVLLLPDRVAVDALRPDFAALKALRADHLGAVIVTAAAGADVDAVFRYFTPWHGKDESAVAGSALGLLAPFWAERLGTDTLRTQQRAAAPATFTAQVAPGGVWLAGQRASR